MIDNCRSALLFKMQIFSILFCVILLGTNSHLDITDIPFLLESPNFPNPYIGKIPKNIFNYSVSTGYGVIMFFYQFLAGPNDCVVACDQGTINCQSLCGDVMDHPRIKKVLRTNFSATINMQSFKSSDDLYHSGISAIVLPYNLKNPSFFTCNSTIDLAHRSPFFLVSQNYPYTPTDFSLCTIHFMALETIRFAFYDFISNASVDSFVISGETLMNGVQNISYSGKHVTDDEPFALYFKKSASVSFIFSSHNTFYTRGFYIIVNSYSQSKQTSESCINNGIYDLSKTKNLHIGSVMFGTSAYAPNMNCFYKFYNTQKNHLIAFELEFESEKCCDIMEVNGVAASPFDDQNYQGFMGSHFNFAMNDMVTMKFLSDGILGGPGFRGVVYDVDCSCHSADHKLDASKDYLELTSPGLLTGSPTYCPNLNCLWKVDFPANYDLISNFEVLDLRSSVGVADQINIVGSFGQKLFSSTAYTTGPQKLITTSGPIQINFTSSNVRIFDPKNIKPGFRLKMQLKKKILEKKTLHLNDYNFMMDISVRLFQTNETYEFVVNARRGRYISIFFFTRIDTIVDIDIYNGSTTASPKINIEPIISNIIEDGPSLLLRSYGESIVIRIRAISDQSKERTDFQAMVTDWSDPIGKCPPMVWSLHKHNSSSFINLSGNVCYVVLHVTNNYDPSIGISTKFSQPSNLNLYKGLGVNATHLMTSNTESVYPKFIYGNYITISYPDITETSVTFEWNRAQFSTALIFKKNQSGMIMTQDYLPSYPSSAIEQQFSIELIGSSIEHSGIRMELIKDIGNGYGNLQMEQYNDVLETIRYPDKNGRTVYEGCCTKMVVNYNSPGGTHNGLLARYSIASLDCSSGYSITGTTAITITLLIFFGIICDNSEIITI